MNRGLLRGCLRKLLWKSSNIMSTKLPIIKEPYPACGERRQGTALAGWGSLGLRSNQTRNAILPNCLQTDVKPLSCYNILLHL